MLSLLVINSYYRVFLVTSDLLLPIAEIYTRGLTHDLFSISLVRIQGSSLLAWTPVLSWCCKPPLGWLWILESPSKSPWILQSYLFVLAVNTFDGYLPTQLLANFLSPYFRGILEFGIPTSTTCKTKVAQRSYTDTLPCRHHLLTLM